MHYIDLELVWLLDIFSSNSSLFVIFLSEYKSNLQRQKSDEELEGLIDKKAIIKKQSW